MTIAGRVRGLRRDGEFVVGTAGHRRRGERARDRGVGS
jgi:hypothetical protein